MSKRQALIQKSYQGYAHNYSYERDMQRAREADTDDYLSQVNKQAKTKAAYNRDFDQRVERGHREYQQRMAIKSADAELEIWEKHQAALQESKIQSDLSAISSGHASTVIDTRGLYQEACSYYHSGQKPLAAQTFWNAFICGETQAAYDLFQLFYNGDGIQQNQNIGLMMLGVAFRVKDQRVEQHRGQIKRTGDQDIVSGVLCVAAREASRKYTEHKVTPEIMKFQQEKFRGLIQKENEHFQVDVFYNPITDYMVEHYEVPVAGDGGGNDGNCDCCVIL